MNVHLGKRDIPHEFEPGHDHAGDPEENDFRRGGQCLRGIVESKLILFLGPSENAKGPKPGGKPRVKDIGVLFNFPATAGRAALGRRLRHPLMTAISTCKNGNPVSPPDLPGNAPVPNVLHPIQVHLRPPLGNELNAAILDRFDGGTRQGLHLHEPLW